MKKDEYYIGVDVARSQNTNNNQSSLIVGKVIRDKHSNKILTVDVVYAMNIPNIFKFLRPSVDCKEDKKCF